jgi:hypothetical protein
MACSAAAKSEAVEVQAAGVGAAFAAASASAAAVRAAVAAGVATKAASSALDPSSLSFVTVFDCLRLDSASSPAVALRFDIFCSAFGQGRSVAVLDLQVRKLLGLIHVRDKSK